MNINLPMKTMGSAHTSFPLQEGENKLWQSFWCRSQDGLRLHARHYPVAQSGEKAAALPVICLPGLSRNAADFHELAVELSGRRSKPREVLALDYRGRGRSDYDSNPAKYDIPVEMQDVMDVMTAIGFHRAIFIGTSRGGLITMGLSTTRPGAIAGVVLNDIGPVIEGKGLARIKGYVGKIPALRNYDEAVQLLMRLNSQHFTALSKADWERFARRTFKEGKGGKQDGLVVDYDPRLMKSLEAIDIEKPLPVLWPYFEGLKGVPVLSIRGSHSDLFSEATQTEMARRHPALQIMVVEGEGHAPMLTSRADVQKIAAFVAGI